MKTPKRSELLIALALCASCQTNGAQDGRDAGRSQRSSARHPGRTASSLASPNDSARQLGSSAPPGSSASRASGADAGQGAAASDRPHHSGLSGPRCRPDDPKCGPFPYSRTEKEPGASASEAAPRTLVTFPGYEDLNRGTCRDDGECVRSGCGNHCVSWQESGFGARCPLFSELGRAKALCGCVNGRCGWFAN